MRIVSGIQPTGNLHLGNYLGAIRNWVRMQDALEQTGGDCFFFLADLHAISQYQEPAELHRAIREMAAALIACGIDPDRATLFRQRDVPAHSELAWLLNGVARVGWLNRMTQFKDKSGKNREGASVALYTYPVLQAADVLLYNATHVPVGEDQKQHLELARDIATKFNTDYGVELFVLPEPTIPPAAARIMSLRDGAAKMSKSDPSDMSRVNLNDDPDLIAQKVKKAKSDPDLLPADPAELEGRPEAKNLVTIYSALSDETVGNVLGRFAGQGFGAFKPALAELMVETLRPIGQRLAQLQQDPAELDRLLAIGAEKARAVAEANLKAAYKAMGL
jgi:tryptophanyl-tRNA synthetase